MIPDLVGDVRHYEAVGLQSVPALGHINVPTWDTTQCTHGPGSCQGFERYRRTRNTNDSNKFRFREKRDGPRLTPGQPRDTNFELHGIFVMVPIHGHHRRVGRVIFLYPHKEHLPITVNPVFAMINDVSKSFPFMGMHHARFRNVEEKQNETCLWISRFQGRPTSTPSLQIRPSVAWHYCSPPYTGGHLTPSWLVFN